MHAHPSPSSSLHCALYVQHLITLNPPTQCTQRILRPGLHACRNDQAHPDPAVHITYGVAGTHHTDAAADQDSVLCSTVGGQSASLQDGEVRGQGQSILAINRPTRSI